VRARTWRLRNDPSPIPVVPRRWLAAAATAGLFLTLSLTSIAPVESKPSPEARCQKAIHKAGQALVKARSKKLSKCGVKAVKGGVLGAAAACLTAVPSTVPGAKAGKLRKACAGEGVQVLFPVCVNVRTGCGASVADANGVVSCLECNLGFLVDCMYALTFAPDALPTGCFGPAALRFSVQ